MRYSHEPDFIHEVFGHQAMLMIPEAQRVLQKMGLASLGATQDELQRLAAVYWYTFEVGLVKCHGQRKILGGAILTSLDESSIAMNPESPTVSLTFDEMASEPYLHGIQYSGFQPSYVMANSPFESEFFPSLESWLDSFLQKKPFVPLFEAESRSILIRRHD